MRLGIIGRKVGMTQLFDVNGLTVPVTVLDTSNCYITQVKSAQTDGYSALQVGVGKRKPQNVNKPMAGHYKKGGVAAVARVQEMRLEANADMTQFKSGSALSVAMFQKGDIVDVTSTTRGKGFTGVMKRFGFSGKDATHGTSKYFRHGGSNGTNTFPGKVLKNHGMPGQAGNCQQTVQSVTIFDVRPEDNLLLVRGAVPGAKNGMVVVRTGKKVKSPEGRSWVKA